MHYGHPDDLDPFAPAFRERFVAYARTVARVIHEEIEGPVAFMPIKEISTTPDLPRLEMVIPAARNCVSRRGTVACPWWSWASA